MGLGVKDEFKKKSRGLIFFLHIFIERFSVLFYSLSSVQYPHFSLIDCAYLYGWQLVQFFFHFLFPVKACSLMI